MGLQSPPLPDILPGPGAFDAQPSDARASAQSFRPGAWFVTYNPVDSPLVVYDGTIRIEHGPGGRTASGDMYQRPVEIQNQQMLQPPPRPELGIPTLSRSRYRYYIRVTRIVDPNTTQASMELEYQMWHFDNNSRSWAIEGAPNARFRASMSRTTAPEGFPSANDYFQGEVESSMTLSIVGHLKMGWISSSFRKAVVEIDTVHSSEAPENNGNDQSWATVFSNIGWDITVDKSDARVPEPSGKSWSDAELHSAMLKWREYDDLDTQWRYHILAVNYLDSTPRGIMYDAGATDSDQVPREGIGISSHWIFPMTSEAGDPDWGSAKGQRFGTMSAPYFRTAVHELGHALGLVHNTIDLGFMNTTDVIARESTRTAPFPDNIKWSFAVDDIKRLRHFPDIFVRPGGVPFGMATQVTLPSPIWQQASGVPGLTLEVKPLLSEVPLGAPVRVNVALLNNSGLTITAPRSLSLKSGFLRGRVKDASHTTRTFSPLVICVDSSPMDDLGNSEVRTASVMLLRGADGALFPSPGVSEITLELTWNAGIDSNEQVTATGRTTVIITSPETPEHAAVAHKILTTPNAHLVAVLGGYHLDDGISVIGQALHDKILRPHFAAIEARRLTKPFLDVKPDICKASKLMETRGLVMTSTEENKLKDLFAKAS